MSDNIFLVKKAIENIMNDVIQQAFNFSINHPQNSDQLNILIKEATDDTSSYVSRLNEITKVSDETVKNAQLNALVKELKRKSLNYLSEIQELKDKETFKT